MKMRNVTAILMAFVMTAMVLAGCGTSEETVDDVSGNVSEDDGETAQITVALMCLSPMDSSATDHVEEALNELLLEKVNVQADFMWFDASTYATEIPMMLQAGETLDLMMITPMPGAGYQSFMSQSQLMDITEYVEEYGTNINEVMGEYLEATTKDGKLYAVGNMQVLEQTESIFFNKDVLDELGLTEQAESMTTWTEYQEILTEVVANTDLNGVVNADAEGSCISPQPYLNGGDSFEDAAWVDTLGDSYQYVYGDEETDEVKCYFESDEWYETVKKAKEMYDAGLVYKDASTAQDYAETLIKNGVGVSEVKAAEFGGLGSFEAAIGGSGVEVKVTEGKVSTGTFQKFGFAVPVTAENPEAAVKVMDLLFGDTEFQDTITWGVEGVDYEKNDDGTLTYPEGVTADTVQYHTGDFLYGNRLTVTAWEGDGADIREQQAASNETVEASKYLGFSVNSDDVTNEITACKNIVDQYKPQLSAGIVDDVDATYEEFISALYAAGMDTIIENYQTQLDEWLAAQ